MTPRLSAVLTELDLPLEELQASRLDGELYAVGDGFAPIDEFERSHHRALSLRAVSRPRLIAERMTAAWVHGATPSPPVVHEFCVSTTARSTATRSHRGVIREVVISDEEVVAFSGIAVTTPGRTAIDLLRADARFEACEASVVARLLLTAGWQLHECRNAIEARHKLAGKRRALARIEWMRQAGQELTRYTS